MTDVLLSYGWRIARRRNGESLQANWTQSSNPISATIVETFIQRDSSGTAQRSLVHLWCLLLLGGSNVCAELDHHFIKAVGHAEALKSFIASIAPRSCSRC